MKKFVLIILIVLSAVCTPVFSKGYEKVDRIVQNYPNSFSNPDQLAKRINRDFNNPEEKTRAIFTWIALNIAYDIKALNYKPQRISFSYTSEEEKIYKLEKINEELAVQTLRRKRAVCQGYSTLFKYLCDLVSVECIVIPGSSKSRKGDIGKFPGRSDHAWNAVLINDEWKLIDVTWGAGYANENSSQFVPSFNDHFFFTPPDKFSLNHYPEDPAWLLTNISKETFANLPLYYFSFNNKDVEVAEPKTGNIPIPKNKIIRFVLKNSKNESVAVKFDNEKYGKLVQPRINNDYCFYEIEYKKNTNTFLTVFVNKQSFVTFKVSSEYNK
ncbi:MAG: transglutaminase protein [uncultured bacterium]|nr:MAG: transglutaminase protein [uncultured bacterium]